MVCENLTIGRGFHADRLQGTVSTLPSRMILLSFTSPFTGTKVGPSILAASLAVPNHVGKVQDWDCTLYIYGERCDSRIFSSVNIPWPEAGMGDADYLYVFHHVVMPIAMEFSPELVFGDFFPIFGTRIL